MKNQFIIAIFFLFSISAYANNNQALTDSAANYYTKGNYEKAISAYEKVLASGYEAADLYYNLGNSYFKIKQYPKAILNFERARLLNPNDEDISFNLELCKRFVVDKIEVLPQVLISTWLGKFTGAFHSDTWAILSIISFILCLALIAVYLFMNILLVRKISFWAGVFMLFVSALTFLCSWEQKKELDSNKHAIIFSPTVNVKSSPDENGTVLFVIHEGLKVAVQDKIGEWYKVKLSDGNVGWLKINEVEVI